MKRGISANTWVLGILGVIIVLAGADIVRRYVIDAAAEAKAPDYKPPSYDPPFKVGDAAPDFKLPDKDGKEHSLYELVKGDTVVSFLCGCNHCRAMQLYLSKVQQDLGQRSPQFVGVTTQSP